MKARKTDDYTIGNTGEHGVMVETAPSIGFRHRSRNALTARADLTPEELNHAEQVHNRFPAFKTDRYA